MATKTGKMAKLKKIMFACMVCIMGGRLLLKYTKCD